LPAAINPGDGQICFLGETLFDYRDYLAQGDPEVLRAAWQKLIELELPLHVLSVRRPEAAIWKELPKASYSGAPYLLASSITPEQFSTAHTRKGSRLRRLFRMGIELRQYSGEDKSFVTKIYLCKGAQGGAGTLFQDELRRNFMCEIT